MFRRLSIIPKVWLPRSRFSRSVALAVGAAVAGGVLVERYGRTTVVAEETPTKKKRIVILGTGWAAMKFLKDLNTDYWDVSVVSPRNYFLFTPLLPSACVGTLDFRSIVEPVRKYCYRTMTSANYYEACCVDADFVNKAVVCKEFRPVGHEPETFRLDYDYLVVAVGAVNNTFNTPGVPDHTFFLKEVEDAQAVRNRLVDCFEAASLPHPVEERNRLLSFVVVGGGPTGVEFAAELHDFIHEDLSKWYAALRPHVQITLIQSGDHILNTYDNVISKYTEEHFARENIQVLVNTRVIEVTDRKVIINNKTLGKKQEVPFGLCVWSTGIAPNPLIAKLIEKIPEQTHSKVLVVDKRLRVQGVQDVYAMGDCATLELKKAIDDLLELFKMADTDGNGVLSFREVENLLDKVRDRHPHLGEHRKQLAKLYEESDVNHDGSLDLEEFRAMIAKVDSKLTALPATAQVAAQEGEYLAKTFNKLAKGADFESLPRFKYHHRGSFAYVGRGEAVLDFRHASFTGFFAYLGWRTAYWSTQLSMRNMVFLSVDWTKTLFFGRDISRY